MKPKNFKFHSSNNKGIKSMLLLSLLVSLIFLSSCAERKLTYYPDGTLKYKSIKYKGGKTKQINFHNNGRKSSVSIQKESYPSTFNTYTVKHIKWNEEGNKTLYKKGKKEIEWEYYPSGNLKRKYYKKRKFSQSVTSENLNEIISKAIYEETEWYDNGHKKKIEKGIIERKGRGEENIVVTSKITWDETGNLKKN